MDLPNYGNLKKFVAESDYTVDTLYKIAVNEYDYKSDYKSFKKYVRKARLQKKKKDEITNVKAEELGIRIVSDNATPTVHKATPIDLAFPTENEEQDKLLTLLRKNDGMNFVDLCNQFEMVPYVLNSNLESLRKIGYEVVVTPSNRVFLGKNAVSRDNTTVGPFNDTEITFGICSDLHFGSLECQLTAMNEFGEICKKEGVQHMFMAGDMLAGHNVYKGQWQDLYATGADEQVATAVRNLPRGFQWYMLGGNHDYSFLSGTGHNPLRVIANLRDDVNFIGYDEKDISLLPGVDMRLWHPSGGSGYSMSYKLQKGVEHIHTDEMSKMVNDIKERPSIKIFVVGHFHTQMQAMYGSIMGLHAGCFEGSTNYITRKGLVPTIGGWVIKATLKKGTGFFRNFEAKFHMFEEIKHDYVNYKHTLEENVHERADNEPVFGGLIK